MKIRHYDLKRRADVAFGRLISCGTKESPAWFDKKYSQRFPKRWTVQWVVFEVACEGALWLTVADNWIQQVPSPWGDGYRRISEQEAFEWLVNHGIDPPVSLANKNMAVPELPVTV